MSSVETNIMAAIQGMSENGRVSNRHRTRTCSPCSRNWCKPCQGEMGACFETINPISKKWSNTRCSRIDGRHSNTRWICWSSPVIFNQNTNFQQKTRRAGDSTSSAGLRWKFIRTIPSWIQALLGCDTQIRCSHSQIAATLLHPEADVPCADHWFYGEAARCSGKTVESSAVLRMMHGGHDRNPFVNTWSLPNFKSFVTWSIKCCLHPRSMTDGAKSTAPGSKKKACSSSSCGRGFCWKKTHQTAITIATMFQGTRYQGWRPSLCLAVMFFNRWGFMGAFVGHPLRVGQDSPAALSGLHFRSPAHNFKEFGSPKKPRTCGGFWCMWQLAWRMLKVD